MIKYTNKEAIVKLEELKQQINLRLGKNNIEWSLLKNTTFIDESIISLKCKEKKIDHYLKIYKSGISGQRRTVDALKLIPNTTILENIQTPSVDLDYSEEHDVIVITPSAIYTIEVKNVNASSAYINEQGVFLAKNKDGSINSKCDVAAQIKRHHISIRNLLKGTEYEKVPVIPVICFSNNFCPVYNNFKFSNGNKRVRDCCLNTISDVVWGNCKYPKLTEMDITCIKNLLLLASSRYPDRKYEFPINTDELETCIDKVIRVHKNTVTESGFSPNRFDFSNDISKEEIQGEEVKEENKFISTIENIYIFGKIICSLLDI